MSAKGNIVGAAAALTLVGGLGAVGTIPASAATPQCGPHCIEVFSPRFGTPTQPNFVDTAGGAVAKLGQPAILYSASSSNPAEDWIVPTGGTVPAHGSMPTAGLGRREQPLRDPKRGPDRVCA